jgi:lipopolysaccharide heptosyltransferase II
MFIFYLRKKKFNVVFLFHRSFTRALICYLAGIKRRIGYKRKKTDFLLTDKVEIPNSSLHRAEYFTNLVAAVGINPIDKCYDFYIDEEAVRKNIEMLSENGITQEDNYVVLNPGGNWDPKRWPAGSYAQLADKILQNLKLNVVISGAKKDVGLAENIKSQMQGKAVILTGKTNLKELGALFKGARAVISADSGPMHLAAALNVPVIALFGPTSPHITGPYGKSRHIILQKDVGCQIPCYEVTCPDNKCMKAISVNEVFEALKSILSDYAK